MIERKDNVFHLKTNHYSYLLRINDYGQPEHLHFGAPVELDDFSCFLCRPGLGWGESVLLKERDTKSCADDKALEWSGSGRGDYREPALEIPGCATDLRFSEGTLRPWEPMGGLLPQPEGAKNMLELTLTQPGLELKLFYTPYETALTRRAVVKNTGSAPVTIGKLMSFCLDLPGSFHMRSFHGGWISEMTRRDTPVQEAAVRLGSATGASSNRCNPGFLLYEPGANEDWGQVYGFNLIFSGNHYASAQRSLQGITRVVQGINPENFSWTLAPGEEFRTPEAVLCCSDRGFGELSARMHQFVNDHIVPEYWRYRERPILYNSWEGCAFKFDHFRLLDLADRAKNLGCELFVLDDGWFGKRNDDTSGLGDYQVNTKKLSRGLDGLGKALNKKGLQFGLWFEPESVSPDSDLYRAHPDWALTDDFEPVYGRNQLLLDLTRPEVRDYIVEQVGATLDSAPITYVKWDMNRHSPAVGARAYEYTLGLYEVLGRIFRPRPQILLESCSSGGNRFDLGMLRFSPQIWCSDNTDPICRLEIQESLSYLYPQSAFGAHVSADPHAQTLRHTPLNTRANVAFFGCLGYELDLKHLLDVENKAVKAQVEFYKAHRALFQFGPFRRIEGGWQVGQGSKVIAGRFHKLVGPAPGYERLRLKALDPGKRYRLVSRPQKLRTGQFGGLLKHVSPVEIDPNGILLRTVDRHFDMPDGGEDCTLTGAALMAGMLLKPLFRGTGYDAGQRTQGDFGSDVYVAEEVKEG